MNNNVGRQITEEEVRRIAEQIAIAYFDRQSGGIQKAVKTFFESTTTPTLTEDERVILRNIVIKNYDIIGKNSLGVTFITSTEDSDKFIWIGNVFAEKLFQFIKERRRIRDSRTFERRVKI